MKITCCRLRLHLGAAVLASVFLHGCGGGGDGGGGGQPVVAPTVPVASAMTAYLSQTGTQNVSGTWSASGISGNATGTITRSTFATTTFENLPALAQGTRAALILSAGSESASADASAVNYYEPVTYQPLGTTAPGQWAVTTSRSPLPTAAKTGDNGTWYTMAAYTSSAKTTRLGTIVATYSVQVDDTSNAVLSITSTVTPTNGPTQTTVTTYRVGSSGAAVPLQQKTAVPEVSTTLVYR